MKIKKIKKLLSKFCENNKDCNEIIKEILKNNVIKIDKEVFKNSEFQKLEKEEEKIYKNISEKIKEGKKIEELLWVVESKSVISNKIYYENGFKDAIYIIFTCLK